MVSCHNRPIIGDKYIVTCVEREGYYGLTYTVKIKSLHPKSNQNTWNGNRFTLYTDKLYTVGDTIKIY